MTTGGFLLRVIRLGFLLIMVLAAAPIHSAFAQAPLKIRVGWITTPASLVPLLFVKPGVTKHHGKSYMFEPIHFASSSLQITALSQGELDLAAFGYTSFPLDLDGKPDLKVIQESIEKVKELGFIKETVDASKYADLSLIEEATRRRRNGN